MDEDIEEDTKRWKNISFSSIGRINIVKMSMLPRAIYTSNATPIKISMTFFKELEQTALQFVWNQKRCWIAKELLKRNKKLGHHVARFQAILQSCDQKDNMVLAQKRTHRLMEQNREPRYGPSALWATNLWQSRKKHPVEKRVSSINGAGKIEKLHAKEWKLTTLSYHTQRSTPNGWKTSMWIRNPSKS